MRIDEMVQNLQRAGYWKFVPPDMLPLLINEALSGRSILHPSTYRLIEIDVEDVMEGDMTTFVGSLTSVISKWTRSPPAVKYCTVDNRTTFAVGSVTVTLDPKVLRSRMSTLATILFPLNEWISKSMPGERMFVDFAGDYADVLIAPVEVMEILRRSPFCSCVPAFVTYEDLRK